jgi:hypothetical protein
LNTIFLAKRGKATKLESGEPGPKIGKHMRPSNLALLAENSVVQNSFTNLVSRMPAKTGKLSSHFNVILIIMASSLKNGLLITTQKDARCTSPKPHWNEESGRFLLLTKSTCLRLHQRNCGLLHVSLLPSQCLQQLDVM